MQGSRGMTVIETEILVFVLVGRMDNKQDE